MDLAPLVVVVLLLYAVIRTQSSTINITDHTAKLSSCLLSVGVRNFTLAPSPLYEQLLNATILNLRFTGPAVAKPVAVVLPNNKHQLRHAVLCSRRAAVAIRICSGGHSYEGLSYTTAEHHKPFAVVELTNLDRVTVDPASATAWAESGATLGDIYFAVSESSNGSLGFSAGSCPTVGSGGHIAGGGFGLVSRKHGLAADNVVDAVLVDAGGRFLDRASMGEDVFWAIRGGGGGNWGAIYAWRIRLFSVPERVTVFTAPRIGTAQRVAELISRWQHVGPSLPDEFYLSLTAHGEANGSVTARFIGQYLGPRNATLALLAERFAELEAVESEFVEMSWIESVVHFAGLSSLHELKERVDTGTRKNYFKGKSDYVRANVPIDGVIGALDRLASEPRAYVILDPYGGFMGRVRSDHLPFPHRGGNLYGIQYMIDWTADEEGERCIEWLRGFYEYMQPWVSQNPRAAYVNYVDLDLGFTRRSNKKNRVAVDEARVWGERYFLGNFDRLVKAKTLVDPDNVFNNAQSIPPLTQ